MSVYRHSGVRIQGIHEGLWILGVMQYREGLGIDTDIRVSEYKVFMKVCGYWMSSSIEKVCAYWVSEYKVFMKVCGYWVSEYKDDIQYPETFTG